MKRIITVALAVLMLVSMTAIFSSAHKDHLSLGTVPATDASITIDGVKDDAYNNSLVVKIDQPLNAAYNPIDGENANGELYLLVSNDYKTMYAYAYIFDKSLDTTMKTDTSLVEYDGAANDKYAWMHDGVELFFDPSNSKSVNVTVDVDDYPHYDVDQRNSGLYQYRMEANNMKTSWANGATDQTSLNSTFEAKRKIIDATHYTVEFKIDLTVMGSFAKGSQVGFQTMINDKPFDSNLCYNVVNEQSILTSYGNSPCVWASQDWMYIQLGTKDDKGNYEERHTINVDTTKPEVSTGSPTASATADKLPLAGGILLIAAAGAVVLAKKKR